MILQKSYDDIPKFFRRRFFRVVVPFIFFIIVYELYKGVFDIFTMIKDVYYNEVMYHLWFVYMILELYLFAPIISGAINTFSEQKVNYALKVWLGVSAIATFQYAILGVPPSAQAILEYVGYFFAGWAIHFQKLKLPRLNSKSIFLSLGAIVVLLACLEIFYTRNFNMTFYYDKFCDQYSLAIVIGSMLIFKYFRDNEDFFRGHSKLSNFISKIGALTYGGYLIHVLMLDNVKKIFINSDTFLAINGVPFIQSHIVLAILSCCAVTFILSLVIIKIFSLRPILRRFT